MNRIEPDDDFEVPQRLEHRLSTRKHRRQRRRRRRRQGRMTPAHATQESTRTRMKGWIVTKNITRRHRYEKSWYFENYGK